MWLLFLLGDDQQVVEQEEIQRPFVLLAKPRGRLAQLSQRTFLHEAARFRDQRHFLNPKHLSEHAVQQVNLTNLSELHCAMQYFWLECTVQF